LSVGHRLGWRVEGFNCKTIFPVNFQCRAATVHTSWGYLRHGECSFHPPCFMVYPDVWVYEGPTGCPASMTPAIGALQTGIIALKYPGVLYWGFTNVDEILQVGFTTSAPGQGLLAQIIVLKIIATAMCKGSGLVGGLYAPSLFIGAASGALYGNIIGKAINTVMPGHNAVAHPQAYALVYMCLPKLAACCMQIFL
jgi:hypothetical protein